MRFGHLVANKRKDQSDVEEVQDKYTKERTPDPRDRSSLLLCAAKVTLRSHEHSNLSISTEPVLYDNGRVRVGIFEVEDTISGFQSNVRLDTISGCRV